MSQPQLRIHPRPQSAPQPINGQGPAGAPVSQAGARPQIAPNPAAALAGLPFDHPAPSAPPRNQGGQIVQLGQLIDLTGAAHASAAAHGSGANWGGGSVSEIAFVRQENRQLQNQILQVNERLEALMAASQGQPHGAAQAQQAPVQPQLPANPAAGANPAAAPHFLTAKVNEHASTLHGLKSQAAKLRLEGRQGAKLDAALEKADRELSELAAYAGKCINPKGKKGWAQSRVKFLEHQKTYTRNVVEARRIINEALSAAKKAAVNKEQSSLAREERLLGQKGIKLDSNELAVALEKAVQPVADPRISSLMERFPYDQELVQKAAAVRHEVLDAGGSKEQADWAMGLVLDHRSAFAKATDRISVAQGATAAITRGACDPTFTVERRAIFDGSVPKVVTMIHCELQYKDARMAAPGYQKDDVNVTAKFDIWRRNDGTVGVYDQDRTFP